MFVASLRDVTELAHSNPHRITTVISLCAEPVTKKAPDINYLQLPISDDRRLPVGAFDKIIDAIAENVRWGRVAVNCYGGMVRSPIIVAAWMDVCGYKNVDAAISGVSALRPITSISAILLNSVKKHLR
jgi:protein-tyrosine phosphatase